MYSKPQDTYIYNFNKSYNKVQSSSYPIEVDTFAPGEKDINGGDELPHTQWNFF